MNNSTENKLVTGNILKVIACFSMLIDHVDVFFLDNDYSLRCIGRIAFPIFIFLMCEGYMHTHAKKKYLLRLVIFSLISEVPYDLLFNHKAFFITENSVMWTLTLGFICINILDKIWPSPDDVPGSNKPYVLEIFILVTSFFIGEMLDVNYGATGILAIILCYTLMRVGVDNRLVYIAIVLLLISFEGIELWGLLGLPAIMLYSGELGKKSKPLQLAFYAFYPVHLLLIYLILTINS